jgi:hypothetical protein
MNTPNDNLQPADRDFDGSATYPTKVVNKRPPLLKKIKFFTLLEAIFLPLQRR